jgi:hemolysin activation/secretion protein
MSKRTAVQAERPGRAWLWAGLVAAGAVMASVPAVRAADEIPVVRYHVSAYQVEGPNPLDAARTDAILSGFVGDFEGVDGLLAAADALEKAFSDAGYSFHRVNLPPQKLDTGTVRLQVTELTVGKVTVSGQQFAEEAQILGTLPALTPGVTPNTREIGRDLDFANLHPTRKVLLSLKEGEAPDTIDADLKVEDQRPWQLFAALNNIGTDDSGNLRLTLGGQHTNLWKRDHRAIVTYTRAPDAGNTVLQTGFQYQAPLYFDASTVTFSYTHSDVDIGRIEAFSAILQDVAGAGDFLAISFAHRLHDIGRYSHGWSLGLQDKLFENEFEDSKTKVRSRPIVVDYNGAYRTVRTYSTFYVQYAHNVTSGEHNNDDDYVESPRIGAEASWNAWRLGGTATVFLPRQWMLRWLVDAQLTDQALIAGEQFGIGGVNSVRGFEERSISGDKGYRSSLELWTPPANFIPGGPRALAFADIGQKSSKNTSAGEPDSDTISSAGFGVRWLWEDQLGVNLDYGHYLGEVQLPGQVGSRGNVKWHFTVFYRY